MSEIASLLDLLHELRRAPELEIMLDRLVVRSAALLGVERATVRLLDENGARLLVGARAGVPLHEGAPISFVPGEGLVGWVAQRGETLRLDDAQQDPRFQSKPHQSAPLGAFLGVPLIDGAACIGVFSAIHPRIGYFTAHHQTLLELAVGMASPFLQIGRLRRLSRVDPLTGALNRRGLDEVFPEVRPAVVAAPVASGEGSAAAPGEGSAAAAPGEVSREEALSVVLVDIDHFKLVNDEHGHAAGDEALIAVVQRLGGSCRKGDAVVRLGGEEFVLILPGARMRDAERIAERARRAIEASPVATSGGPLPLTISAGVAERRPGEGRDSLLRRADEAMYEAKRQGRNRVVLAPAGEAVTRSGA